MVLGLITANIVVFCLWKIADFTFMYRNFTISVFQFKLGQVHTLITSAFSHSQIGHIVSNMLGLYLFGTNIGRVFGPGFLLKLYLAGGIGGSVFFLVHQFYLSSLPENMPISKLRKSFDIRHPFVFPASGASGSVTATIFLGIFLHPTARLYFIIPVPAMLLGIFLLGQDFLRVKSGYMFISGSTHLGGATVAAIVWVWARLLKRRR
ncbi:hypothetical protein ACLB2K_052052 [Fragaria x ananassa]